MNRLDHLLVLTIATYGLCYILMHGSIFNRPRNFLMRRWRWFQRLITCPLCTGFWCGGFMYQWHILPVVKVNKISEYFCDTFILPFACYSAVVCYVGHLLTEILLNKAYPCLDEARCPHEEEGIDSTDYNI
jgi:hypothetical protein